MSQDSLIFNGKKYISSRRASEITGYTTDYIGQLARGKKISSRMVGRNRFVDENQLLEYKANFQSSMPVFNFSAPPQTNFDNQIGSQEIEHAPGDQTAETESSDAAIDQQKDISDSRDQSAKIVVDKDKALRTRIGFVGSLLVIMLVGVFLNTGAGAYGLENFSENLKSGTDTERASSGGLAMAGSEDVLSTLDRVDAVFLGYLDSVDQKISMFVVGVREKILAMFEDEPDVVYVDSTNPGLEIIDKSNNADATTEFEIDEEKLKAYVREIMLAERNTFAPGGPYGGVVALPSSGDPVQDEILKERIKASFSDDVTVQFDSSGSSGVIRPVFKSGEGLSENYMFLLVPVNK